MLPFFLTAIEQKALREFKRKIKLELGDQVLDVKLFGSKARGDFKENSDIDILVLLKKDSKKEIDAIFDVVTEIVLSTGVYLSVKYFSIEEYNYLNSIPTVFMKNFRKDAVSL